MGGWNHCGKRGDHFRIRNGAMLSGGMLMPTRYTEAELKEQESTKWAPVIMAGSVLLMFIAGIVSGAVYVLMNFGG